MRFNFIIFNKTLFVLASLTTLTACQQDISDLQAYVAQVNARPPGIVDPIPEQRPYLSYTYPQNKRDPFNSVELRPKKQEKKKVVNKGVPLDINRPPELLESYPLDSLNYVGTVTLNKTQWALIKVGNGTVHRAKKGNFMGENHGKIMEIRDTKIILQETVSNGLGGYKHKENSIELSK
jgi:type IV pilus assembly protein PilP